jgi:hypothetical protein
LRTGDSHGVLSYRKMMRIQDEAAFCAGEDTGEAIRDS